MTNLSRSISKHDIFLDIHEVYTVSDFCNYIYHLCSSSASLFLQCFLIPNVFPWCIFQVLVKWTPLQEGFPLHLMYGTIYSHVLSIYILLSFSQEPQNPLNSK